MIRSNRRLAFGSLALDNPIAAGVAIMALGCVVHTFFLWREGRAPGWIFPTLGAGIVGNATDRLADGVVTDWLALGPVAANLADLMIAIALVAHVLVSVTEHPSESSTPGEGR
jgi:lipoprotein signal peptidase